MTYMYLRGFSKRLDRDGGRSFGWLKSSKDEHRRLFREDNLVRFRSWVLRESIGRVSK